MPTEEKTSIPNIGTLNEKPLHAAIKTWYAEPHDRMEVELDGYVVDILRGDLIIEIQTRNFSKIRQKLSTLADRHPVRLVYPVPSEKWIVKADRHGTTPINRRKSPKHGSYEDLFEELVSFPSLITNPNFSLEVLLIQEEETRVHEPQRAWRRKGWITAERRLLAVIETRCFNNPEELMALFPQSIDGTFKTSDLASVLQKSTRFAGKMAYCLREMGAIVPVGKQGRAIVYTRSCSSS